MTSGMEPLSSYTFADPKVVQNPYPYYARMRTEDAVHFDEGIKTWLVTRYEDIIAVARDSETYSDEMRVSNTIRSPYQAEVNEYMQREGFVLSDGSSTFKIDGEMHTRRRKLVSAAFTGPTVAALEERVARICHERAAAVLERTEVDLVREYAMPIPILVICDALGLPMDHVDDISRGADSMVARAGAGASREEAYRHADNVMGLQRFVRKAIEERRAKPSNDLISQIVHARIDDPTAPQLSEKEVISICVVAVAGGVDTTRNAIAFGLYTLATRPDLLQRLRDSRQLEKDPARFNDEVLRFYSPVPQLPRIAKKETVLGGKTIPEGANVFLCWAAGNRDPQRFSEPERFDPDRSNLNSHRVRHGRPLLHWGHARASGNEVRGQGDGQSCGLARTDHLFGPARHEQHHGDSAQPDQPAGTAAPARRLRFSRAHIPCSNLRCCGLARRY